ncbi:MAG: polysulfide reductase NrfD [Acidobacteria bacterium]|nr:polysulfide reductase NrfD [Acidobacteriota bacterium]
MAGVAAAIPRAASDDVMMLRHLPLSGKGFWLSLVALAAGASALLYGFLLQVLHGHAVTGQGSHGAIWGIVVANIVNFIGISHVGIAISAVVRILRLERYRQLARLAEFVTLAAITTAVLNIGMDVGRPERFIFNVVWYGRYHAPFVWSCTVITTYVVGSSVYLYLAMRRDLWVCSAKAPVRRGFFRVMSLGYTDTPASRARHNRVVWWLAVIILPIMVSVHSVYGYIFGLQAGRPGWYNPFQAPYFVLGAIVSGFSAVIIVLAVLRKAFHWEAIFHPRMFKGLGIFLGFVTLLYMYFLFSEWLTGSYASPEGERVVFRDLLAGRFSLITWSAVIAGMLFPFALLFVQGVNPRMCSIPLTVLAALLINVGLWTTRALIVVPSFYHPLLPWDVAPYTPAFSEWCIVVGSFFLFALLLLVMVKMLPVLELPEDHEGAGDGWAPAMPFWKQASVGGSAMAGMVLIGVGVANSTRPEFFHPPAIWLSGILLLLSVPFQICVLPERARRRVLRQAHGVLSSSQDVVVGVQSRLAFARQARVGRYLTSASSRAIKAPVLKSPVLGNRPYDKLRAS